MVEARDRLIVALDVATTDAARRLVDTLGDAATFYKIGLWLLYATGSEALIDTLLGAGRRVFLDAKMYDIGETVREGVARAADRGVSLVTVHGDREILAAAAAGRGGSGLKVFAISVLTSLDDAAVREMGYLCPVDELLAIRVRLAVEHGIDGMIAAPVDAPRIRALAGAAPLELATPGVRPAGQGADDHKRPGTPADAIRGGADYIVMGRPIVRAPDPAAAARAVAAEMQTAFDAR